MGEGITAQVSASGGRYLGRHMHAVELTSPSANTSFETLESSAKRRLNADVPTLSNSAKWTWVEVDLTHLDVPGAWLEVSSAMVDSLVVFASCHGQALYRMEAHGSGRRWSRAEGALQGSNYPKFPLPSETCDDLKVYVGVQSGKQLLLPVRVASSSELRAFSLARDLFYAFYVGIMVVMLLYNLVLYFTVRDRSYLLYTLFLIGVACSQLFLEGYQGILLGVDSTTWLGMRLVHLIGIFSGVTTILFVQRFLHLKRTAPRYHQLFRAFVVAYGGVLAVLLLGFLNLSFSLINAVASVAVLVIPASLEARKQGQKSATFLLIAFTAFLLSVTVFALKEFGVLPHTLWTRFAMPVGSIVQLVLLSIALADRINQLKKESSKAREEKLRVSQLNERMVKEQNQVLESKVRERTEALESQNESLEAALQELKVAQDQLVQNEKLASIGQLTAGIAHELNNPINFVSSSAQSLRRDFEDVSEVMERVLALGPDDPELQGAITALQEKIASLDLGFTMKEIEELLTGIEDGAQRTTAIVKGLRIFSRMDGDEASKASINELLESTSVILRSSFREEASVVLELSPDDTVVMCQPGKLNQVFMNLISNAVQATVMSGKPFAEREVRVRTRRVMQGEEASVQVAIADNGVGMDEDTQAQIFDPFFTTKEVGEGTGLGLSIVKGILDDHRATLELESKPGEGTTFLITFPA
jgi:signal transduction histidine kinase